MFLLHIRVSDTTGSAYNNSLPLSISVTSIMRLAVRKFFSDRKYKTTLLPAVGFPPRNL